MTAPRVSGETDAGRSGFHESASRTTDIDAENGTVEAVASPASSRAARFAMMGSAACTLAGTATSAFVCTVMGWPAVIVSAVVAVRVMGICCTPTTGSSQEYW